MRSVPKAAIVVLIFLILPIAVTSPAVARTCPQAATALRAGNALIKAARAGSSAQFASALRTYADMRAIALFGLGRHRKALPQRRESEFASAVTHLISRTFNDYRRKFRAQSIDFVDCRGGHVHTQMFFLGGRGHQPVIWRFNNGRIVDVNVQSLWLGQLLRTHINDQMKAHDGNIEGVIREMQRQ